MRFRKHISVYANEKLYNDPKKETYKDVLRIVNIILIMIQRNTKFNGKRFILMVLIIL